MKFNIGLFLIKIKYKSNIELYLIIIKYKYKRNIELFLK